MRAHRLVGVGVGPGDPELVTVKGVRMLREADLVVVPVLGEDTTGRAERTVRAYVDGSRVRRAVFALDERAGVTSRRAEAWAGAARLVAEAFATGARDPTGDPTGEPGADAGAGTVAFATIGDPNVYSTFTYLASAVRELCPDVVVETVPGVTAMQDLAARSGTVLCEGREPLTLLPLTAGLDPLARALAGPGTVVAYKGGRHLPAVRALLVDRGRLEGAVHGASLGLPGEQVGPVAAVTGAAAYLSTVIVPARRNRLGGKL